MKVFEWLWHRRTRRTVWNLWEHQGGWGHNLDIRVTDDGTRTWVIGHLPSRYSFKRGDELRAKMQSGRVGRYRVKSVKYYCDPPDMLCADLKEIGYV